MYMSILYIVICECIVCEVVWENLSHVVMAEQTYFTFALIFFLPVIYVEISNVRCNVMFFI